MQNQNLPRASRSHLHQALYSFPPLADRNNRDTWVQSGELDARARATELVNRLLARPRASLLPEAVDAAARRRLDE